MKSTHMTPKVQLDQTLDICVDVSKSKLNVYFELGDQAFDDDGPIRSGKSRSQEGQTAAAQDPRPGHLSPGAPIGWSRPIFS